MMSKELDLIINRAVKKANQLSHEYLTLEQLMWSLLQDQQVLDVLSECGAVTEELLEKLDEFLQDPNNFSILTPEQIEVLSQGQFANDKIRELATKEGIRYQPEISMAVQRVLQRAALHVQSSGKKKILGVNLLIAMFGEEDSHCIFLMQQQGIDRFRLIEHVAHDKDRPLTDNEQATEAPQKNILEDFTEELTAKENLEPVVGRKTEIEAILQVLCRKRKNNPLLVGDAGVGKTILSHGLAALLRSDEVPETLKNTRIFSLDLMSVMAGARFRGDFEERFKAIIKELDKIEEKVVLFVDEIHSVVGVGSTGANSMDASNLLKPILNSENIRCLGTTTHEEYRRFIEKDHAFSRRFKTIDINEPSVEDTFKILQGLRAKYEDFHGVKYSNSVLRAAINLSSKHISDRKLPDKALDIIDEAGARVQLSKEERKNITIRDIELVISDIAKIPRVSVASNEKDLLMNLEKNIKLVIFGQNSAVESVSDAIISARSGLRESEKPIGCFLFAGPTGVGKTELAKQVAFGLGIPFMRFDMSEYMEKHAVAKLIGAPPGYVGYESGGVLTDSIKKSPHCVLLLDEIEKAHSDIYNILLQVMDHGILTDSHGRKTDFRNVVLIMTTNAGAKELEGGTIGLNRVGNSSGKVDQALKNFFTPEFRNRLDEIIHFSKLGDDELLKIVDKFISELQILLDDKRVELKVDDKARNFLAKKGFDSKMGARPLARIIENKVKKPLSREIIFGKLEKGGTALVSIDEDKLIFTFESK